MYSTKYWDITTTTSDRYNYRAPATRTLTTPDCYPNTGYAGFDVDVTRIFRKPGSDDVVRTEKLPHHLHPLRHGHLQAAQGLTPDSTTLVPAAPLDRAVRRFSAVATAEKCGNHRWTGDSNRPSAQGLTPTRTLVPAAPLDGQFEHFSSRCNP